MAICVERDADLHMAQLMLLPLTVSCFDKIQICFTFLVPAHPGSPGKRAIKRVCVRVKYHSVRHTPVGVCGRRRFLERRHLQQVVVGEVGVAHTASPPVVQSVAHATRAVVVADQVTTDRVGLTLVTPHATFVYVLRSSKNKHTKNLIEYDTRCYFNVRSKPT